MDVHETKDIKDKNEQIIITAERKSIVAAEKIKIKISQTPSLRCFVHIAEEVYNNVYYRLT